LWLVEDEVGEHLPPQRWQVGYSSSLLGLLRYPLELLVLGVLVLLARGTLFLGLLHLELNLISFFLFFEAELIPEIVQGAASLTHEVAQLARHLREPARAQDYQREKHYDQQLLKTYAKHLLSDIFIVSCSTASARWSVPFAFCVGGHARGGFAGGWFLPIPILAGPQLASIIIVGSVFGQALAKIADTLP
jgi:hypothetical protein